MTLLNRQGEPNRTINGAIRIWELSDESNSAGLLQQMGIAAPNITLIEISHALTKM